MLWSRSCVVICHRTTISSLKREAQRKGHRQSWTRSPLRLQLLRGTMLEPQLKMNTSRWKKSQLSTRWLNDCWEYLERTQKSVTLTQQAIQQSLNHRVGVEEGVEEGVAEKARPKYMILSKIFEGPKYMIHLSDFNYFCRF